MAFFAVFVNFPVLYRLFLYFTIVHYMLVYILPLSLWLLFYFVARCNFQHSLPCRACKMLFVHTQHTHTLLCTNMQIIQKLITHLMLLLVLSSLLSYFVWCVFYFIFLFGKGQKNILLRWIRSIVDALSKRLASF